MTKIYALPLGPIQTNCYIVVQNKKALIIDPGNEAHKVIQALQQLEAEPVALLLTHAHHDHIGALDEIRDFYEIEAYSHINEAHYFEDPSWNLSASGRPFTRRKSEHFIEKADTLNLDGFTIDVLETPGHSPGSISFVFPDNNFVVSGDALFRNSIGRTDLPGSKLSDLEHSIREVLYKLPDHFTVFPGHGPATQIGYEKETNPFYHI